MASTTEPFRLPCRAGLTAPAGRFSRSPAVAISMKNRTAAWRGDSPPSTAPINRSGERRSEVDTRPLKLVADIFPLGLDFGDVLRRRHLGYQG
jgi:hypothetical protein